jgi:hypothetical protein
MMSFALLCQNKEKYVLKFDGLYQTKCDYEDVGVEGEQQYLRLYPNGIVISVGTDCSGNAKEIAEWFYLHNNAIDYSSTGSYERDGNKIKFSTVSKAGEVKYKGRILKNGSLKLRSESLINGFKIKELFKFVTINNLK